MPVGNRLKEVRRNSNVSQLDLAEEMQVSRRTIIALEENKYDPSAELALKLSTYLETPVEEIFHIEERKQEEKKNNKALTVAGSFIILVLLSIFFNDSIGFFTSIFHALLGGLIGLGISKVLVQTPKQAPPDERTAAKMSTFTNHFLSIAIGIFTLNSMILFYKGYATISIMFFLKLALFGLFLYLIGVNIYSKR